MPLRYGRSRSPKPALHCFIKATCFLSYNYGFRMIWKKRKPMALNNGSKLVT